MNDHASSFPSPYAQAATSSVRHESAADQDGDQSMRVATNLWEIRAFPELNDDGTPDETALCEGYFHRANYEVPWVIEDPDEPARLLFEWEVYCLIGGEARWVLSQNGSSPKARLRLRLTKT